MIGAGGQPNVGAVSEHAAGRVGERETIGVGAGALELQHKTIIPTWRCSAETACAEIVNTTNWVGR